MHDSSYEKMSEFVDVHLSAHRDIALDILDFGSQVVDSQGQSYRPLFDAPGWSYRGLDIEAGHNVDVVVADAYNWVEVQNDSVDVVISGQALEHVEFFWASVFEIVRVLRPGGLAVIIAPSGGFEHRYPLDCWRFYRDGFVALNDYAGCELVDAFTDWGNLDWEDSILVMRKPSWDDAGQERFHRRSMLQRALLDDSLLDRATFDAHWSAATPTAGAVSGLSNIVAGALTTELESHRAKRLDAESSAADAAQEALAAQVDELNALRAHVDALQSAPGPVHQAYGSARARIANLAGDRGRQLYKKLRGRTD
jgi:SAM-dependent methyltransferase